MKRQSLFSDDMLARPPSRATLNGVPLEFLTRDDIPLIFIAQVIVTSRMEVY